MPDLELIWDAACPNVSAARNLVQAALVEVGLALSWTEWRIGDPRTPPHARDYGSPTILVDGRDVVGAAPSGRDCCRVYADEGGRFRGVPSLASIVDALRDGTHDAHPERTGG